MRVKIQGFVRYEYTDKTVILKWYQIATNIFYCAYKVININALQIYLFCSPPLNVMKPHVADWNVR